MQTLSLQLENTSNPIKASALRTVLHMLDTYNINDVQVWLAKTIENIREMMPYYEGDSFIYNQAVLAELEHIFQYLGTREK